MSTTYSVLPGDTFDLIARKVYGTEAQAVLIREANPGVAEPLTPGAVLFTPPDQSRAVRPSFAGTGEDVSVRIGGREFRRWTSATIVRAIDSIDTLELSAPFDHTDPTMRDTFRPFAFPTADVLVAGEPLFTGTQVGVTPSLSAGVSAVEAAAYALPGVLADCTLPVSALPFEYSGLTLAQIASRVCRPFGLAVVFDVSPGPPFEQVACKPGQTGLDFLTGLAKQRGIVIGSTPAGALLFQRSALTGSPVARLAEGSHPVLAVTPSFTPQQYYSHITGLAPVAVGEAGSQFTVKNARLLGALRPTTFTVNDAEGGTVTEAVRAKAGRMFANMVSYTVAVSTWRDSEGALWSPNTTVTLHAPSAMVYAPYELEVRSVRFTRTDIAELAELSLVLPGAYAGAIPESMPWDG